MRCAFNARRIRRLPSTLTTPSCRICCWHAQPDFKGETRMWGFLHMKLWPILFLAVAALAAPASAQTFPTRTMRIIVPYPPGGSIDLSGRVIAKYLQDSVGQSVIVENKPGANAIIGIDDLMRSEPDGHTLIILSDSPVTINVHLSRVNYDPLTDLVP